MLYILGLVWIALIQSTQSRFIQATCRAGTRFCVQQNSQGTWCYSPMLVGTVTTSCAGEHLVLQGAVDAHVKQDLSIAYYNGIDNARLGGVDYPVNATAGMLHLCLSNRAGDGLLQTLCMYMDGDNSVDGNPYCLVTVGPPVTTDGCYVNLDVAGTTTSTTATTSSTTSSTTSPSTPAFIPDPTPISTRSNSLSAQSTAQSTSGASNDSTKPKPNKVTTIVAVVLTILVLIAIAIGFIFWRRHRRLERQMDEFWQTQPGRGQPDLGGRGY